MRGYCYSQARKTSLRDAPELAASSLPGIGTDVVRTVHRVIDGVGFALLYEAVTLLPQEKQALCVPHRAAVMMRGDGAGRGSIGVCENVEPVVGGGNTVPAIRNGLIR